MKIILLVIIFIFGGNALAQGPYYYLEIVVENGDSWVNIRSLPLNEQSDEMSGHEGIKTISFMKFLKTKQSITKSEGFLLAMELQNWQKISQPLYQRSYLKNINEDLVDKMAEICSLSLFGKKTELLNRQELLMLWLCVSRVFVFHDFNKVPLDFKLQSKEISLVAEFVWTAMPKNSSVSDIRIFSLHDPESFSVSLLVDSSDNIMTKVMVCPEIYYKDIYSLELINKSSKELKSFGALRN